jgi:hypothetical protein
MPFSGIIVRGPASASNPFACNARTNRVAHIVIVGQAAFHEDALDFREIHARRRLVGQGGTTREKKAQGRQEKRTL